MVWEICMEHNALHSLMSHRQMTIFNVISATNTISEWLSSVLCCTQSWVDYQWVTGKTQTKYKMTELVPTQGWLYNTKNIRGISKGHTIFVMTMAWAIRIEHYALLSLMSNRQSIHILISVTNNFSEWLSHCSANKTGLTTYRGRPLALG